MCCTCNFSFCLLFSPTERAPSCISMSVAWPWANHCPLKGNNIFLFGLLGRLDNIHIKHLAHGRYLIYYQAFFYTFAHNRLNPNTIISTLNHCNSSYNLPDSMHAPHSPHSNHSEASYNVNQIHHHCPIQWFPFPPPVKVDMTCTSHPPISSLSLTLIPLPTSGSLNVPSTLWLWSLATPENPLPGVLICSLLILAFNCLLKHPLMGPCEQPLSGPPRQCFLHCDLPRI